MLRSVPILATLALMALMVGLTSSAQAAIVATSPGNVSIVNPPPTGTLNEGNATYESNTSWFIWEEGQYQLGAPQTAEWSGTGNVFSSTQLGSFSFSGEVTSYFMRFDKVGGAPGTVTIVNGAVTFDKHIIGVYVTGGGLAGSDATFAPAGLTYGATAGFPNFRALDLNAAGTSDRFTISPNGRTLNVIFSQVNTVGIDALRIVINPEPGTWALFGLGVLGLGGLVRRRRRRRSA